jgi:hypothetical protein
MMRVRSLTAGAALLAMVCGGGIAHASHAAPAPANNLNILLTPTHFGRQGDANALDALAWAVNIQLGYSFDSSGQFNATDLQSSSAYDGVLLSAPALNLPYAALTSDSSYVGSTISLADGLRMRFGAASLSAQNPEIPSFGDIGPFDGPQQYDLRTARTGLAGMDWDFASWGGLGVVASHTSEQNGVLGADAGAMSLAKSADSTMVGTSAHVGFGDGWVTTVSYSQGITNLDLRANNLAPSTDPLHNSSYGFAIAKHGVFGDDSIGLSVIRPIQVYSGDAGFQPSDGLDTGADMAFWRTRDSLLGQTPETDLEFGYVTSFFNGALALQANAGYQMNLAGQSGTNSLSVISRAKINF